MAIDTTDPLVKRTLGDFVVEAKLGEGGFGAVYKAKQLILGREAVIKVLHAKHRTNPEVIERFKREAHLASRLEHPYNAHIYSFGVESDGLMWIAMEYVAGTPLNEILKSQGALPLERFVPLFDKICEVIFTAHEFGIIHRDLKPANVMVISRAGRLLPKLLDFGIAKGLDIDLSSLSIKKTDETPADKENASKSTRTTDPNRDNTETEPTGVESEVNTDKNQAQTGAIGSPAYMAPEQWESAAKADARTDIYALGVLAYESLTNNVPFPDFGYALMYAHLAKPVPPLGKGFPIGLDTAISKAMAKEPQNRYQTALEFAKDFREAAGFNEQRLQLPQLDETLQEDLMLNAPRPLAETVASLSAASNVYQLRDRISLTLKIVTQYTGLLALACQARLGTKVSTNLAQKLVQKLRRQTLKEAEWAELGRELCRPFALKRDAFPIPELVSVFFAPSSEQPSELTETFAQLMKQLQEIHNSINLKEEQLLELIAPCLSVLTKVLYKMQFLSEYYLVLPSIEQAEKYQGLRKPQASTISIKNKSLPVGRLVLTDSQGNLILSLWPLIQASSPSSGANVELFMLDRRGRHGAKLVSLPSGFECENEAPWDWLKEHFLGIDEKGQTQLLEEKSPYLGLTAFSPDDSAIFFGREKETESFLNRLRVQSLLAVVGPSGAGKSSFIQAGVIPGLPGGWQTITVRPGNSPIATLAAKLTKLGIQADDLQNNLTKNINALGELLRTNAEANNHTQVLVIDQFEEIFTLCLDKKERQLYVDALVAAARSELDSVRIILTMRDDFLIRAKELPSLRDRLTQSLELLTTPVSEDLLKILIEPAHRASYEFEDRELPLEIVNSVLGQVSALPLIAFTAAKLWEQRDRQFKQLRRKTYEAMGGVGGALAKHAEEMLQQMTNSEQALVREAFRHLVTSEGTRAVLTRPELLQLLGKTSDSETVLEKLISTRLLVATEGEKGVDRVEVVHEALLSAWPRLVKWRQEDAEGSRLRDQLRATARQWEDRGRPKGLLWRDEALTEYKLWRSRYAGKLTNTEEAFGRISVDEADRNQRNRRIIVISAMVLLVIGLVVLFIQRKSAIENAEQVKAQLLESYEEQGRQELLNNNYEVAALYLNQAYSQGRNTDSLRFMLAQCVRHIEAQEFKLEHTGKVVSANYSFDGKYIVTATEYGDINVWEAASGKLLNTTEKKGIRYSPAYVINNQSASYAFFSSNTSLIVICSDNTVQIRDISGKEINRIKVLEGKEGSISYAISSKDGHFLLTQDSTNIVKIWDIRQGTLIYSFTSKQRVAGWLPDSKNILLHSENNRVALYDIETKSYKELPDDSKEGKNYYQIRCSPDSKFVVAKSSFGMDIWSLETGQKLFTNIRSNISELSFSPDSKYLLSGGGATGLKTDEKYPQVFDPLNGKLVSTLVDGEVVRNAYFSSDSEYIITESNTKVVKIWDVDYGGEMYSFSESNLSFTHLNPQSKQLLLVCGNIIKVINLDKSINWIVEKATSIKISQQQVVASLTQISPNGKNICISTENNLDILDTQTHNKIFNISEKGNISPLCFNHMSSVLAYGISQTTIKLVNFLTGEVVLSLNQSYVEAIFTPDDKKLIIADPNGNITIYEISSGKIYKKLGGLIASHFTFSKSGEVLIAASIGGYVKSWSLHSGQELFDIDVKLADSNVFISSILISSDNEKVIVANGSKITGFKFETNEKLFDIDTKDQIRSIHFIPNTNLIASVGRDLKIWDLNNKRLIFTFKLNTSTYDVTLFNNQLIVKTNYVFGINTILENRHPNQIADLLNKLVDIKFDNGRTVVKQTSYLPELIEASLYNHLDKMESLISKNTNLNVVDNSGTTALMYASQKGHIDIVTKLAAGKADLNIRNTDGYTALMLAVDRKKEKMVELLINLGANLNLKNRDEKTALIIAVEKGYIDLAKLLLNKQVDVNAKDNTKGTALTYAVCNGYIDLAELLINKGADLNIKNNDGISILSYVANSGNKMGAEFLIKKGIDINAKDKNLAIALMFAANSEVATTLINAGSNVNEQNINGKTALMFAAENSNFIDYSILVKTLIAAGADVNVVPKNKKTALIRAVTSGYVNDQSLEAIKALIAAGADVNAKDENGKSVLILAMEKGNKEIIEELKKAGAK